MQKSLNVSLTIRSGSWGVDIYILYSWFKTSHGVVNRDPFVGFRLCRRRYVRSI